MSRSAESGAGEREPRGPLGMVAKVGAVVTTLGALVALVAGVKGLLPSDEEPAGAVGKIEKLDLNSVAPISEASREVPDATDCPGVEKRPRYRVRRPTSPVTVAATARPIAVFQEEDSGSYSQDPGGEGETPDPIPTEPTEPPDPEEDTGDDPGGGGDGDAAPDSRTPPSQRIEPGDLQTLADLQQDTDLPTPEIEQLMFNPSPSEVGDLTEAQVAGIIENTRKDDPSSPTAEPIGWLIDVTTRLENLADKCAYVHWSLYDAKTLRRVRYAWVTDRRGARFVARASPDARSSTFWVPAPIERRRYMVRVALYDAEATRLDLGRIRLPP